MTEQIKITYFVLYIVYDIVYNIAYDIRYILYNAHIYIPCVNVDYKDTGNFSTHIRNWVGWKDTDPLEWQANSLFPWGSEYSLKAKCWHPANRMSDMSSRKTVSAGRLNSSSFWAPSASWCMDIISKSPLSMELANRSSMSVSTSSALKSGLRLWSISWYL